MSPLKMAVVGVGALGRHHARILSELPDVELVAVAEPNAVTGQAVAQKCNTRWVLDYRELFDAVDAVSIVVPTFAHLAVASEFLTRKIPVLVEKPLAAKIEHGEQLVQLAEENDTLLQVGHIERFNPATTVAWSLCSSPKYIRAERVSPYAFRSTDIGAVHDLMIHDLDLVLDLAASPVRSVDAFGVSIFGDNEDTVQARVTFENGCVADLTANRVNPNSSRTMQIWSAEGTVTVDFTSREVVAYRPTETLLYGTSPLYRAKQPGADIEKLKSEIFGTFLSVERPAVPQKDALTAELESFVDCVRHNRTPLVDGRAGLRAMQLADQILASVHSHQWEGHAGGAIGPFARPQQALRRAG